ncbi:unnamed protein product [Caenorhabditis nigoni]
MFGYPDEMPLDVLKQMNHELVCRKNATEYIVQVCDSTNPTREFGDVKMVAPVVIDTSLDWLSENLQSPSLKTKCYLVIENLAPTLRNMVLHPATDPILRMLKIESMEVIRKQVTGAMLISTILRNKDLFKLDDDVVQFLRYSMVPGPTSASVERAFSHLNFFKSSGSSSMQVSMENARLRGITNRHSITTFDPAPATMRFIVHSKPIVDDERKGGMTAIKQENHLPFSERQVILRPARQYRGACHIVRRNHCWAHPCKADEMDRRNTEIEADIDEVNKKMLRDSIEFGSSIDDALKYLEITLADNFEVPLLKNSLYFYF